MAALVVCFGWKEPKKCICDGSLKNYPNAYYGKITWFYKTFCTKINTFKVHSPCAFWSTILCVWEICYEITLVNIISPRKNDFNSSYVCSKKNLHACITLLTNPHICLSTDFCMVRDLCPGLLSHSIMKWDKLESD